jgi:photosystem II stability/assembly factor-like uncharacterized protein
MKKPVLLILVLLVNSSLYSQNIPPTPASERLLSFNEKQQMEQNPLIENLEFKSIGPVIMSGRVTDVDGNPDDSNEFYVAYASGGLWKTKDMGESFTPLFDYEAVMSIGDIAVNWKFDEIIWVGTGENNSSRSSYSGAGIYKSTDKGKTWQNMGLNETNHTGRIVLHPDNPDIVWVAAMGHLYSRNPERGVYKTVDGGKTWEKTLFVNDKTGAIDLIINPENPDILYAAMWERQAWRWDRHESGSGSGIYKSTDGGENWELISTEDSGFPTGQYVGRIGIDIYPGNPDILYAYLDNQTPQEKSGKSKLLYKTEDFKNMSAEDFSKLDPKEFNKFLKKKAYPRNLNYDSLKLEIESGKRQPADIYRYKTDTSLIPVEKVMGVEVYRTDKGGKEWYRTHKKDFKGPLMSYSYGYYFGEIRVFPDDPDKIILGGLVVSTSKNGGKKIKPQIRLNVHLDHHAFWINPKDPDFIINGNDGGINISSNGGRKWKKINPIPVGQFYSVGVDMEEPYNVYGGLQDNGVWMGPSDYDIEENYERKRKVYPYKRIHGGDGMQVQTSQAEEGIWVYTGSQFGDYSKRLFLKQDDGSYKSKGKRIRIRPYHTFGESPLRFNWQTPILLSQHNDSVFYMGSNKMHKSKKKGLALKTVSDDLPEAPIYGDIANGTITAISESPLNQSVLYAGTDDGLLWISTDTAKSWTDISIGLPVGFKVYSIDASAFSEGRAYVAMNGYYSDNFEPLLFKTEDFGKNWIKISGNLPMECINKVLEDPKNQNILYVGTDHGLYISTDRGEKYFLVNKSLPYVAVHDLIVHPRENDLIVATHGRSLYKVNVEKLQKSVK